MNKYEKYSIWTLGIALFLITFVMGYTYIVDPLFHYHAPNHHFNYSIDDERYQNDGILRHFDYDAIITGTSMTENFKASEFDQLFNVKSVKVPFSGGSYKEINDNLKRAFKYNKNIRYVIRSLDREYFFTDKNYMLYDSYPTYLTDDDIFNDYKYLLNKNIFISHMSFMTKEYDNITSFDEAHNWNKIFSFGAKTVLKDYNRAEKEENEKIITKQEISSFKENISENIVSLIKDNPDTMFYYYLTPYSIIYWDNLNQTKNINRDLLGQRMVIETLIEYKNVSLFSFDDDFELITNLNNYKDILHYSEDINSYILRNMKNHTHELTKDNYEKYLKKVKKYYENYDYDKIFENNEKCN